jgi:hypothetical protein
MPELREELDNVLQEGPLTKESLNKLHKMNSFLRESSRLSNCGFRKLLRVYGLSVSNTRPVANTEHHSGYSTQRIENFHFQRRHSNPSRC